MRTDPQQTCHWSLLLKKSAANWSLVTFTEEIRSKLLVWSLLLKKSLIEKFIFCAVYFFVFWHELYMSASVNLLFQVIILYECAENHQTKTFEKPLIRA